ncbi:MAG: mandelate racemase/muconate lactonizing enzyme family protein [Bryobacteraceae bacterium]
MNRKTFLKTSAAGALVAGGVAFGAPSSIAKTRIKITKVLPIPIKANRDTGATGWMLVRVQTDQGVEGIGEGFPLQSRSLPNIAEIRRTIESIGTRLVGTSPLDIEGFLNRFASDAAATNSGESMGALFQVEPLGEPQGKRSAGPPSVNWVTAISAIEIALWDIAGQVAGLPIHALLGGRLRQSIPIYANHGVFNALEQDTQERFDRAIRLKEAGFKMFKWDPFRSYGNPGLAEVKKYVKEVQVFRDGFGPDYLLAIDVHTKFNLEGALRVVKELEPFNLVFLEEPIPPGRSDQFRKISDSTSIPLAAGERMMTRREAKELLDSGAIQVIQPEIGNFGGILAGRQTAALAELYNVKVAMHSWCSPVLCRAAAHVSATIPNLLAQEYPAIAPEYPWEREMLDPPTEIRNGEIVLTDRPGLGSKLNEKLIASRLL